MIKVLFTSDWHLGNSFHNYDREEDHRYYFDALCSVIRSEEPDALVLCGDIFDNSNPSASSQELFYRTLVRFSRVRPGLQIVLLAGNHDNPRRIEAGGVILREIGISVHGLFNSADPLSHVVPIMPLEQSDRDRRDMILCAALPFLRPLDIPSSVPYGEGVKECFRRVLDAGREKYPGAKFFIAGHMYAKGAKISEDGSERSYIGDQDVVEDFTMGDDVLLTALGHIHRRQAVTGGENIRYVGSALPMSFSERGADHGGLVATFQYGELLEVREFSVPLLRPLVCIPDAPAPWKEVRKLLKKIPLRSSPLSERERESYLQVNVLLTESDPELNKNISATLEGRKCLLCKVKIHHPGYTGDNAGIYRTIDPERIEPIDMIRQIYAATHSRDMSPDVEKLARQVIDEAVAMVDEPIPEDYDAEESSPGPSTTLFASDAIVEASPSSAESITEE